MTKGKMKFKKGIHYAKKLAALGMAVGLFVLLPSCWLFHSGTPMEEYKTTQDAMQDLPFSCTVPSYIPEGYQQKSVTIITGNVLSVGYENGEGATFQFRAVGGEEAPEHFYGSFNLSAPDEDEDVYQAVLETNGTPVVVEGESEQEIYLAVWYSGGVTYVIHTGNYKENGFAPETLLKIVESTLPAPAPNAGKAMLYTNQETGSETAQWQQHPYPYPGSPTVQTLAAALSELTGLDFKVSASYAEDGIVVEWLYNSTLLLNLDDRAQKDEFHFYDSDSMRWFMMDSLWRTLQENLGVENVYYTGSGGADLVFEELSPVNEFPAGLPYMGSAFYYAHEGGRGEEPAVG